MLRRIIGIFTIVSLVSFSILSLVACSGAQGSNGNASSKVVTLNFWNGMTGPDRPAIETLVKKFNDSHPNIKVTMDVSPWDSLLAKLPTSFVTGQGPDIAAFDSSYIPQYAKSKLILPIDEVYAKNGIDKNVLPPSLVGALKYDGKMYGAPLNFATLMMYYNKDLFKKAGLDPNKPPTNWDEWKNAILKTTIVSGANKQYGLVLADHATIANWPILIWENGGSIVSKDGKKATLNDSKTVEALKTWGDLVINNGITPTNLAGAEADKLFMSGKAAMEITGPWMTTGFTQAGLNYDVAPIPAGPAGKVTLATSVALVAGKNTTHKAEVMEFMKFWDSKESQEYLSLKTGFPPARTDLANDANLNQNPFIQKFASVASDGQFYLQGLKDFSKIDTDVITPLIQGVTNKQKPVDQVVNKENEKLNNILQGKE